MIFFHKESKSQKKLGGGGGGLGLWGGEGGIYGWTVEQAQTNLPL